MKNTTFAALAILLLVGCNGSSPVSDEKEAAPVLDSPQAKSASLADYRHLFKYNNLKAFAIDSFDWDSRIGNYEELVSTSFKLVWQDGKRDFIGQGYDRDYLYSWQSRNPEFVEFTILTQDESIYCDLLHYIIQDKEGKTVDSFIVAAKCGDGGWGHKTTGRFISENTYEQVWIDVYTEIVDSADVNYITEGDSIVNHFTIGKDGKVAKKEIFKTRIRKVE